MTLLHANGYHLATGSQKPQATSITISCTHGFLFDIITSANDKLEPKTSMLLRAIVVTICVWVVSTISSAAQEVPKFSDYQVPMYTGPVAKVRLDTPDARNMRTRLREGNKRPVNFAGHYILVTWGCGEICQTGAVVNVKNGWVTFLPHSTCCWAEGDKPFYYKKDSRLIVFSGRLDEHDPDGAHFFVIDGASFNHLVSIPKNKEQFFAGENAPLEGYIPDEPKQALGLEDESVAFHRQTFTFEICNRSETSIDAAIVYRSDADAGQFTVAGWHKVLSKKCKKIGTFLKGDLLVSAVSESGKIFGQDVRLCVELNPFAKQYDASGTCPRGATAPFQHMFIQNDSYTLILK